MQNLLIQILNVLIAADLFALGVLIVFLVNARINIRRKVEATRYHVSVYELSRKAESSQDAAETLEIPVDHFINYCKDNSIELPEARIERLQRHKEKKEAEQQRIMEEERSWRTEQERLAEERNRAQEEEARKRRERLRKFGFRENM